MLRGEIQFFLVTPENGRSSFDLCLGEHVMENHHLVSTFVTDDDNQRALKRFQTILDQDPNPIIDFLLHHLSKAIRAE